jgi:hypothetical protein
LAAAKAPAKNLISAVELKATAGFLVAPDRLDSRVKEIKTGQTIEIPVGGAALFNLSEEMMKSPMRLISNFIVNQTDAPLVTEVTVMMSNIGLDGFMLREGTTIATCIIVAPVGK